MNKLQRIMEVQREYDPYQIKMDQARKLSTKWEKTGLLEGLGNEAERNNMSILLENQAKQLIKETTTVDQGESWSGVALPLVRRIFGEISAKDFVSVQPMNLPSGLVFYINFKYGTASNRKAVGDNVHYANGTDGGLYGAGAFGYSVNDATSSATTATVSDTAVDADINYNANYATASYGTIKIPHADITDVDLAGARAFTLASASVDVAIIPEFTKTDATNITFVAPDAACTAGDYVVTYHKQPTATTRGDFEAVEMPEINLDLDSAAIVAKTRKLKAVWTPEIAQDLNAYHAIDAEAELTAMLSEHIAMEIDLEILDMLIADAATTDQWDALKPAAGTSLTTFDHFKTLGITIQKMSNQIHAKTMRGGANFLVCSPDVATIIESLNGFNANTEGDAIQFAMGVEKFGNLANRWTVYKNPYMQSNAILVGFRGPSFLETGAVFAPYIPLIMTPLVYDPDTFTPRKGVMTRYAKKMVRPEFYGVIYVQNLDTV